MREEVTRARKQYELARRNRKVTPDPQCCRCGMTEQEHLGLGLSKLQLHHIEAIKDGGHPTDPSNLITLCKFCHDWWHKYCEPFGIEWPQYINEEPAHLRYWKCSKQSPSQ